MTDRELLERAAKAAGIELRWLDNVKPGYFDGDASLWRDWNPLKSDGDAFQLAVKLRLDVTYFDGFQEIHVEPASVDQYTSACEPYADDMGAAVRRAIVRAAAGILGEHK